MERRIRFIKSPPRRAMSSGAEGRPAVGVWGRGVSCGWGVGGRGVSCGGSVGAEGRPSVGVCGTEGCSVVGMWGRGMS